MKLGFPGGSAGKESTCSAGDLGLILGLGRAPGEGKGFPLQYSGLGNSTDYTVAKSQMHTTEQFYFIFMKLAILLCLLGLPCWLSQ